MNLIQLNGNIWIDPIAVDAVEDRGHEKPDKSHACNTWIYLQGGRILSCPLPIDTVLEILDDDGPTHKDIMEKAIKQLKEER